MMRPSADLRRGGHEPPGWLGSPERHCRRRHVFGQRRSTVSPCQQRSWCSLCGVASCIMYAGAVQSCWRGDQPAGVTATALTGDILIQDRETLLAQMQHPFHLEAKLRHWDPYKFACASRAWQLEECISVNSFAKDPQIIVLRDRCIEWIRNCVQAFPLLSCFIELQIH